MGGDEVWWSTGEEDDAAMAARLRALLGDVAVDPLVPRQYGVAGSPPREASGMLRMVKKPRIAPKSPMPGEAPDSARSPPP